MSSKSATATERNSTATTVIMIAEPGSSVLRFEVSDNHGTQVNGTFSTKSKLAQVGLPGDGYAKFRAMAYPGRTMRLTIDLDSSNHVTGFQYRLVAGATSTKAKGDTRADPPVEA